MDTASVVNPIKLATVVGTRPEIIRLSRVIEKCDQAFDQVLIHTGQNYDYELNQIFFSDLNVRQPDRFLEAAGDSAAQTIGNVIIAVDQALDDIKPDALLVLGDTNSCLSVIPAKRRRIPVFHMEAGNRCFDMRVPEEINRRIVDHVADINMPYSDISRDYLLREGLRPDTVITTGSPMPEVLQHAQPLIEKSDVCQRLDVKPGEFFVVSAHREENLIGDRIQKLVEVLNQLAAHAELPIIMSTHPRTRKRMEASDSKLHPLIKAMKPLGFHDYVRLQLDARATLSDSGTITEESSILNFPALNLRDAQERPEGMEEGAVMMVGLSFTRIAQALKILEGQQRGANRTILAPRDYLATNVSDKVVRIIQSHIDFVHANTWKNYP